jgi:hypothetical protein
MTPRHVAASIVCGVFALGCTSSPSPSDSGTGSDAGSPPTDAGSAADAGGADAAAIYDAGPGLTFLVGTDPLGVAHKMPQDWPADAGAWNAANAVYNPASGRIAFHVHRFDILGGSLLLDGGNPVHGVTEYYVAGPGTGSRSVSDTSEVYLAQADGSSAECLTCEDKVDGVSGVALYKVAPATGSTPNAVVRQTGAVVYANQSKDLPTWYVDGTWLVMAVEMPRHAYTHFLGTGELGYFNDLWAVSADGNTWVQLTDYAATWTEGDPVAATPYACADPSCTAGCQYVSTDGGLSSPFEAYTCSAAGAPPPASGSMRPGLSHALNGDVAGSAKLIWAERVGMDANYTWAGVLQLAKADLLLTAGMPALVSYQDNLTPIAAAPAGKDLWSNPGGRTDIGAGYEAWGFSADDSLAAVATDAFHSTSSPSVTYVTFAASEAFTDSTAWGWMDASPSFSDTTRYDAAVYAYADNAAPSPVDKYGQWEEPTVFSDASAAIPYIAFGSSADLTPAWNPASSGTIGLETWVLRQDRTAPALQLTHFNASGPRIYAYPTSVDPSGALYLEVVPAGADLPGAVYTLALPAL